MLKFFKTIASFIPRWSQDLYFALKFEKHTGLLIFNSLKQKKLFFNFFVNRNWKNLTDSRKRAEILSDNRRKSHHPIETLYSSRESWVFLKLRGIQYFNFSKVLDAI